MTLEVATWIVIPLGIVLIIGGRSLLRWPKDRSPVQTLTTEPDWRAERRTRRRNELNDWDRQYRALLPPKPPCTSNEHEHDEILGYGGQRIARICNTAELRMSAE